MKISPIMLTALLGAALPFATIAADDKKKQTGLRGAQNSALPQELDIGSINISSKDDIQERKLNTGWEDGTVCGLGTTCNNCRNPATYWYGSAFTKCGSEPKWPDGTVCLAGTSCNACENPATWWSSKFSYACGEPSGDEQPTPSPTMPPTPEPTPAPTPEPTSNPFWEDGTICGLGTTCNNCRNPATYWYGSAFTKCGSEPKWPDGTVCLAGTSCNACENPATWWSSKFSYACGEPSGDEQLTPSPTMPPTPEPTTPPTPEPTPRPTLTPTSNPFWEDGTVCGLGTTCNNCRNPATYWYGSAFTKCGSEPKWPDGTVCLAGTSCNACQNPATWWWSKFTFACGEEQ